MLTLGERFRQSERQFPGRAALSIDGSHWTYAELGHLGRRIADAIHYASPRCRRLGIISGRSVNAYGALVGALELGVTYVPLPHDAPPARVASMIDQAGVEAVVGLDTQLQTLARWLPSDAEVALVSSDSGGGAKSNRSRSLNPRQSGEAYILFTSGSSGSPKGVPISSGNVHSFLCAALDRYNFSCYDVCAQFADISFDLSVISIFGAWSVGACVSALSPHRFALSPVDVLLAERVSVWVSVPSVVALAQVAGRLGSVECSSVRLSLFCGEVLSQTIVRDWSMAVPASRIENTYGPTEATVFCTAYRLDAGVYAVTDGFTDVPIGWPLDNVQVEIVDGEGRVGVDCGELLLGGPQVFGGYLGAKDETGPWYGRGQSVAGGGGPEMYRTGDVVSRRRDGCLSFVGRRDTQVKVSGHRVNLEEVDAGLRLAVRGGEAVAVCLRDRSPSGSLLAAVVSGAAVDEGALRRALARSLPRYAIPSKFIFVDALPRTASGKVDRRAAVSLFDGC